MSRILKIILAQLCLISIIILSNCSKNTIDPNIVLIGTIAGPETELVEVAKQVAKKQYNLTVNIVPFNDYVEPNRALAEGEINANMFQHQPYLDQVKAHSQLPIISIGELFIYPMGVYSHKYKKLSDLPNNAKVAIPNDASNQERSLLLLEKAGLITLEHNDSPNMSISKQKIIANPKNLQFEEVDPAFMVRMLDDLDLAVINTNYAAMAKLLPNRDALYAEDKESKYANILVVRDQDKDQEKFKQLLSALRSPEVISKAKELFNNQVIEAWVSVTPGKRM
jgi:D-methionine transport system substrate-binding protein